MTKLKKLAALLAALLIAAVPLAACGTDRDSEWGIEDITDMSKTPEDYSLPIGDGQTISYSGPDNWYAPASLAKGLPVWNEVERRLNVKMKWEVLPSNQWNISMMTKINGGRKLADIIGLPNWGDADIDRFAREKVIIPLNELINKYAPNIKRILNENPQLRRQMTSADGGIYSINEFYEANEYYYTVMIRKDWLDRLGLSAPSTVAEFEYVMTQFRDRDANGNGKTDDEIPLFVAEGWRYDYFASGFGLSSPLQDTVIDADGKAVYQKATPEYGQFLAWLNRLYTSKDSGGLGVMDRRYESGNPTNFEAEISKNIIGITVAPGDFAAKFEKLVNKNGFAPADGHSPEYMLINPPVASDGTLTLVRRGISGGQIGISGDCADPVTAIKFIDYLWGSEEGNRLLHFGLEGQTYTVQDGKPTFTEFVLNNPDGLDPGSALRSLGAWPPLFDRQTRGFITALLSPQAIDYFAKNIDDGLYTDAFPDILATKEEIAAFSGMTNEFNTYQQEMTLKFIMGSATAAQYAGTYIPKMEQLGIRTYETLRKAQYERFMSL
jgi:putative aldouronate transport system substrate-binding protein